MEKWADQTTLMPHPNLAFLKRMLGDQITYEAQYSDSICRGLQFHSFDFLSASIDNSVEEKAFLNFYPVQDHQYYFLLTYFPERSISGSSDSLQVVQLLFLPEFFLQWPLSLFEKELPFRYDRTTEHALDLTSDQLEALRRSAPNARDNKLNNTFERLEAALSLLRKGLQSFRIQDTATKIPACGFLNNSKEREKVMEAYTIIMENLETPRTIRELSRMVGINECYLKKGFKATFGKPIHEFQQYERIQKAKKLLQEGQLSINEVAYKMGFGSASHFSTSFKKIAGMKPCELLM